MSDVVSELPVSQRRSRIVLSLAGILTVGGVLLAMVQTLPIVPVVYLPITTSFQYTILGTFLAVAFLLMPGAHRRINPALAAMDMLFAALALGSGIYFAIHARDILNEGWDFIPPTQAVWVAGVLCVLSVEGARRAAGLPLAMIAALFGIFPLFADSMPGFLWGSQFALPDMLAAHAMGIESLIGIPFRTVADLLIGFILYGVFLAALGGGEFFMSFALLLLGRTRGGPAKVSIIASALFGSLSGSAVSNIITTGTFTIPAMRKAGYEPHYAASVEACASTGGGLMPPIMGAAAFLMASFLQVPYVAVISAAIIPSLLFYAALIVQADCYAADKGLTGVSGEEIPKGRDVLRDGWIFIVNFAVLIYVLVGLRMESYAPWIAMGVLIVCALLDPKFRPRLLRFRSIILESGMALGQLVAILAGVGLVVGALSITGVGTAFSRELVQYAGGNVYLLLFFGAITSFVLGMGMTVSACYVFLAVVLGPALIKAGLNPIGSHLYILYWGILSAITPPVAISAITAATIAKSDPMKTSITSMRLGFMLFLVPILFVLNPALIGVGSVYEIASALVSAMVSIILLSCGMTGWLYWFGRISPPMRMLTAVAGLLLLVPEWRSDLAGYGLTVAIFVVMTLRSRVAQAGTPRP